MRYCVGGHGERTNKEVVEAICSALDDLLPAGAPHSRLVTPVTDRPGHDRRYAIDPTRISSELGWQPRHSFEEGLAATVRWYLGQQKWCRQVREQGGYGGGARSSPQSAYAYPYNRTDIENHERVPL